MKQASGRCSESAMLRIEIGRDASKGPGMGNSVNALPAGAQGVSDHRMGVVGGDWKAHQRARCMVTGYLTRLQARRGAGWRRADRVPAFLESSIIPCAAYLMRLSFDQPQPYLTLILSSAGDPISSRHVLYQSLRPPCPLEGPYRSPSPVDDLRFWLPRDCARIISAMPLFTSLPSVLPLCPPTADCSDSGDR